MATKTVIEEVPVEVTNNSGNDQNENKSSFSNLRRRFAKNNDSKRPSDAKWRQQQIPACRPVFSAKHVAVGFTVIGIVFLALGILFTVTLMELREVSMDYTLCAPTDPALSNFSSCDEYIRCKRDCNQTEDETCKSFLKESGISDFTEMNVTTFCRNLSLCTCQINITLSRPLRKNVYGEYGVHVYYGINNYYQNHRRYLNSLDLQQIHGDFLKTPSADCLPLARPGNQADEPPYLPCGFIANSWFNDSIVEILDVNQTIYDIDRNNVAWATDRSTRFNDSAANPPVLFPGNVSTPPNWPKGILSIPGGLNNESLIVWFRVSAFPWFRKLYGRVKQNDNFVDMPASTYTVTITYSYPVTDFNGGKSIILAEVTWLGGRNLFLGIAYIVVAVFLILAAIVLILIHLFFSKWKENHPNFLKRSY